MTPSHGLKDSEPNYIRERRKRAPWRDRVYYQHLSHMHHLLNQENSNNIFAILLLRLYRRSYPSEYILLEEEARRQVGRGSEDSDWGSKKL